MQSVLPCKTATFCYSITDSIGEAYTAWRALTHWKIHCKKHKSNWLFLQSHKVGCLSTSCNLGVSPQAEKGTRLFTACHPTAHPIQPGHGRWTLLQAPWCSWPADVLPLMPCTCLQNTLFSFLNALRCDRGKRPASCWLITLWKAKWNGFLWSWDEHHALWATTRAVLGCFMPGSHRDVLPGWEPPASLYSVIFPVWIANYHAAKDTISFDSHNYSDDKEFRVGKKLFFSLGVVSHLHGDGGAEAVGKTG